MKRKRFIVLGVIAVLVVAYVMSVLLNFRHRSEWERTAAALQSVSVEQLSTAARSFVRDKKLNDSTVPLRTLLSTGYVRPQDVRGLEEKDVTISLDTAPSAALIRVRTSDGSDIVLLADGSIQKLARR